MILDIGIIIFGIAAIGFRKPLAKASLDYQNNTTGKVLRYKLGPRVLKFAEIGFTVVGLIFVILGVLAVLGIIKFQ
jgi:hypothetical protein